MLPTKPGVDVQRATALKKRHRGHCDRAREVFFHLGLPEKYSLGFWKEKHIQAGICIRKYVPGSVGGVVLVFSPNSPMQTDARVQMVDGHAYLAACAASKELVSPLAYPLTLGPGSSPDGVTSDAPAPSGLLGQHPSQGAAGAEAAGAEAAGASQTSLGDTCFYNGYHGRSKWCTGLQYPNAAKRQKKRQPRPASSAAMLSPARSDWSLDSSQTTPIRHSNEKAGSDSLGDSGHEGDQLAAVFGYCSNGSGNLGGGDQAATETAVAPGRKGAAAAAGVAVAGVTPRMDPSIFACQVLTFFLPFHF